METVVAEEALPQEVVVASVATAVAVEALLPEAVVASVATVVAEEALPQEVLPEVDTEEPALCSLIQ